MGFDIGQIFSALEERVGRRAMTILAWLLFLVALVAAFDFLFEHLVVPVERFFGGTGDLRADLMGGVTDPFWPSIVVLVALLAVSVVLFLPFIGFLLRGRAVPQYVLDLLEEQRSSAITEVLNFRVTSPEELAEWKIRNQRFIDQVVDIIRKHLSRADELRFTRLGVLQNVQFASTYNQDHGHQLTMFAKRLDALERIIDRYSGR